MSLLTFLSLLPQYLVSGLTPGSIYGMTALGFTLIYNATGVVNFAQGEFVTYGALIAISCVSGGLPTLLAVIISMLAVMLLGALLERAAIRPARQASVITLIIITIGASMLLRGVAMRIWGADPLSMPSFSGDEPILYDGVMMYPQQLWAVCGIFLGSLLLLGGLWKLLKLRSLLQRTFARVPLGSWREPVAVHSSGLCSLSAVLVLPFVITSTSWKLLVKWMGPFPFSTPAQVDETIMNVASVSMSRQQLWVMGVVVATMILLWILGEKTQVGKAMRACAINRQAAQLMGIPVPRMVTLSFALSGLLGGLAGAIFAPVVMGQYNMGTMLGLKGFAAAILGGMGNPLGAVLGGFLLGMLENLSTAFISGYKDAIAFALMLFVLLAKPAGLLGRSTRTV